MDFHSHRNSNKEKNKAGRNLKDELVNSFNKLIEQNIILNFQTEKNYNHRGFSYQNQYLINFVIETLDNKYILVRSSTSFRSDRYKQPAYDIEGVLKNSEISLDVIASIMLFPDEELNESSFINFRQKIKQRIIYSPASHLLTLTEFYDFLENHKASVEAKNDEIEEPEIIEKISQKEKNGSYYGKIGNALEKNVVNILNNKEYLKEYQIDNCREPIFISILDQFCKLTIKKENIISINATNTVEKLANGGNAKTDVIVEILTNQGFLITKTISIKNTNKNVVSCHDYKYTDFVRVLNIADTKLEEYFKLFQQTPSYSGFKETLPDGFTVEEFESLLNPYSQILTEWALTGRHDHDNLRNPLKQISNYLLIVSNNKVYCNDFSSYIEKLFKEKNLNYGIPFNWTYPSKQRGKRIQLKMPIIIE